MKQYLLFILVLCLACNDSIKAEDYYRRGEKAYSEKNLDEAEKNFSETVRLNSGFLNAYLMLAKISYHNRDYDKALKFLNTILDKDSNHSGALYWKGRVLTISGKDQNNEAPNLMSKVLEIDSHNIPARILLALIYEKNGKYKEAMHEYLAAINEEEPLINARGNLAILYRRLGLKERAVSEINRALKIAEITGADARSLKLIKQEFDKWQD